MFNPDSDHKVVDMVEKFHRDANEERFPDLLEAVTIIRSVLNTFRHHDFIGVPTTKKIHICSLTSKKENKQHSYPCFRLSGRWLENSGFYASECVRVIALSGLFIICPENLPDNCDDNASSHTGELLNKQAI